MGRRSLSGSPIGGIPETQEMLDFCGAHNITADVEVIPIQKVNEAYERLLKSDVKYRFSIDMASLKSDVELITHMAFYSGWPSAMSAITVAKKLFEEGK
jgi:hypothetical protein